MDNLPDMMIGDAWTTRLPFAADGERTGKPPLTELGDLLAEHAGDYVGQEAVTLSTTPAMVAGRLEPRPMLVRVCAVRTADGWSVRPGGYARIGKTDDPAALAMQKGGSVADVWVVSGTPVELDTLAPPESVPFIRHSGDMLPSRAADNPGPSRGDRL